MTPILNSREGLTIDTGEVSTNLPALTLKQAVNDGGEAVFAVLQIEASNTTEDENLALIRGFFRGSEVFVVTGGGAVYGQSAVFDSSVTAGFSSLSTDTLNLAGKVFLTPDFPGVLAQRNGQNPQTFRVYKTHNAITSSHETLSVGWSGASARIQTEKTGSGVYRDLILGSGGADLITLGASGGIGFFSTAPAARPVFGGATAGVTYTVNEQTMLNKVYSALRTLGLAS